MEHQKIYIISESCHGAIGWWLDEKEAQKEVVKIMNKSLPHDFTPFQTYDQLQNAIDDPNDIRHEWVGDDVAHYDWAPIGVSWIQDEELEDYHAKL